MSVELSTYLANVGSSEERDWRVGGSPDSFIRQRVVLSDLIAHCDRVRDQIRDPTEVRSISGLFNWSTSMRTARGLRNPKARRKGDVSAGLGSSVAQL